MAAVGGAQRSGMRCVVLCGGKPNKKQTAVQ